jgi:hypothetical protein
LRREASGAPLRPLLLRFDMVSSPESDLMSTSSVFVVARSVVRDQRPGQDAAA